MSSENITDNGAFIFLLLGMVNSGRGSAKCLFLLEECY